MRQLISYQDIDPEISKAVAKKKINHLWCFVPEIMSLSLFDDNVPTSIKTNMAQIMLEADKGEEKQKEKIN